MQFITAIFFFNHHYCRLSAKVTLLVAIHAQYKGEVSTLLEKAPIIVPNSSFPLLESLYFYWLFNCSKPLVLLLTVRFPFPSSTLTPFNPLCFRNMQSSLSLSFNICASFAAVIYWMFTTCQALCFMIQRTHLYPTEPQKGWYCNAHPKNKATET